MTEEEEAESWAQLVLGLRRELQGKVAELEASLDKAREAYGELKQSMNGR